MVNVARGLATLPTRPPTPPRESSNPQNPPSSFEVDECPSTGAASATTDTPDLSPSSSAENAQFLRKASKRVGFSPWTEYHKAPIICNNRAVEHHLKQLPPSRERRTSYARSILKPFDHSKIPNPSAAVGAHSYKSFAAMLESVVQHLAGGTRSSRLDAYHSLSGALKAYEGVPDQDAMSDKMGLLTQFIRRDMSATTPHSGAADTTLVVQALKLLTIFIWTPELADHLSDEFQSFILDRSIYALDEHHTPKAIVTHHMHLLATQKFKGKIMTSERANRLITALDTSQDHVKGSGIIGQRMVVYQRLLGQARSVMVSRVTSWVEHVFSGMLSTFKPIRARAIAFGIDAGLALGTTSTVSRAVMDVFNRSTDDGKKFLGFLCDRLNVMISSKEDGAHVPQIWSVPVLFLRARRHQLEHWEHMKAWLYIIQKCFNSSDKLVKFQANVAWNRLVFAINPDTSTGQAMVKMLRQPLVSQLDRRAVDKHSKQAGQVVLASYCNLLYYALKPSATYYQLDVFWTQYIAQVFTIGFLSSSANLNTGCQILITLLGDAQIRAWDENRANDPSPIRPEELPRVDPKWVRSRVASIVLVFERIFSVANWFVTPNQAAPIRLVWQSFMKAIGDAGIKEVKVSKDCMDAVAEIFNMLQRLWQRGPSNPAVAKDTDSDASVRTFTSLLEAAVDAIGSLPFTEKRLSRSSADIFQASATPSHKSICEGSQKTPIVHLLDLLLRPPERSDITDSCSRTIGKLLQKASRSRTSRGAQLELLRDWTETFRGDFANNVNTAASSCIWKAIAELTQSSLTTASSPDRSSESARYTGHDYRDVVKILEVGLTLNGPGILSTWEELCRTLVLVVSREAGDGAVFLAVLEPLASLPAIKEGKPSQDQTLDYASLLLEKTVWPSSVAALESSRKAIWGVASTSRKAANFDPSNHTYDLINHFLIASYQEIDMIKTSSVRRFLGALLSLLQRVPLALIAIFLKRTQNGLANWVKDEDRKLHLRRHCFPETRSSIVELWSAITSSIETLPSKDSSMPRLLEPLILSGFQSQHRGVVNETIRMWNSTFGCVEGLEYPDSLKHALQRLRSMVDLQLRNFPTSPEEDICETSFDFIESQENEPEEVSGAPQLPQASLDVQGCSTPLAIVREPPSSSLNEQLTPRASTKRTALKTTPTARLRHDDSQVQFAAIDSSPIGEVLIDSQLLTDRQREVKERQQAEAVVTFPDLRSSPIFRLPEANNGLPRIWFTSERGSTGNVLVDGPTTPTLPPPQYGPMDDYIGSSPTPRSSIREQQLNNDDLEPPSSPPDFSSNLAAFRPADPPSSSPSSRTRKDAHGHSTDERLGSPEEIKVNNPIGRTEMPSHYISSVSEHVNGLTSSAFTPKETETVTPFIAEARPSVLDPLQQSDIERVSDAHSTLIPSSQIEVDNASKSNADEQIPSSSPDGKELKSHSGLRNKASSADASLANCARGDSAMEGTSSLEENVSRVMNSFRDEGRQQSPSSEVQVSSQLRRDLSKAVTDGSSPEQDNTKSDTTALVSRDSSKKRKRKVTSAKLPMKKAKICPRQSNIQVVIEVQRRSTPDLANGDMLDCIVVDSSPVTRPSDLPPSGFRAEQTPSALKRTRDYALMPIQKKKPGRPKKRLSEYSSPRSEKMTPPDTRKRRASDSPTQQNDSGSATTPPASKKRRSLRLSQTSVRGSSQRSNNGNALQDDFDESQASVMESESLVTVGNSKNAGGQGPPMDSKDDAPPDPADGDNKDASQSLPTHSEPCAAERDGQKTLNSAAENNQTIVDPDESLHATPAERDTMAAREELQVTGGLAPDPHQGMSVVAETPIAKEHVNADADKMKPSHDASEMPDQSETGLTPERSQPGSASGQGILGGLRRVLEDIERVVLGPEEEREIDDILFDIRKQVHEAGRRSGNVP